MGMVIGLDLGTTACKAVALAADGRVVASAARGYPLHTPQPGWAEQEPDAIWQGAAAALRDVAAQVAPIAGLCLSGAMHSLCPVADDGAPLAPAMIWADTRAAPQADRLRAQTDAQALYERTGCPLHAPYHPARLRWWRDARPEVARRAARWVALKEWVAHRLTGRWATETGLASTTGLLALRGLRWDDEALALAGLSAAQLPPLVAPQAIVGSLSDEAARATGLQAGLPVVAGGSDGALAMVGAGAASPGEVAITVGTSGAVRRMVAQPWLDAAARSWCYALAAGRWVAGGAINNGGLALEWVRETWYSELSPAAGFARLLADAATVGPGAEGLLLLPYLTGERSPHWDAEARGLLAGLTVRHRRAHVARAALEGVAFCLADVWAALGTPALDAPARLTGGITRSPLWMQIVADVLGLPLAPVEAADASAIGAAMLGHWALGHTPTLDALADTIPPGPLIEPDGVRHALYVERHGAFQELYQRVVG